MAEKKDAKPDTKQTPKEATDRDTLKQEIQQTRLQLANLATMMEKCAQIRQEKRVTVSESSTGKDKPPEEIFSFTLSGNIVNSMMNVVDTFINQMKGQIMTKQNELIDKLDQLI